MSSRFDRLLLISNPGDVEYAAQAIARGAIVGHATAHAYALTTRPDVDVVQAANFLVGRPAERAGSLTTTRALIPRLFDWSRLPPGLEPGLVLALIERLHGLGPFSFRAPVAAHVPDHLVTWHGGIRTALVVVVGRYCPINAPIARALDLLGIEFLHITATRSVPMPDWVTLQLAESDLDSVEYPWREPGSTTIVSFHQLGACDAAGRPALIVEREGTLPLSKLRPILADYGFGLQVALSDSKRCMARPPLPQARNRSSSTPTPAALACRAELCGAL
jgi:hypothetical protein